MVSMAVVGPYTTCTAPTVVIAAERVMNVMATSPPPKPKKILPLVTGCLVLVLGDVDMDPGSKCSATTGLFTSGSPGVLLPLGLLMLPLLFLPPLTANLLLFVRLATSGCAVPSLPNVWRLILITNWPPLRAPHSPLAILLTTIPRVVSVVVWSRARFAHSVLSIRPACPR